MNVLPAESLIIGGINYSIRPQYYKSKMAKVIFTTGEKKDQETTIVGVDCGEYWNNVLF